MSNIAKKVKDKIDDAKEKAVGASEKVVGREEESDYTKIKEHESTAVSRQNTATSQPASEADAKERLRRSGMTEGTAGSTETGNEYEQGAAGTNR